MYFINSQGEISLKGLVFVKTKIKRAYQPLMTALQAYHHEQRIFFLTHLFKVKIF